MTLIDENKTKLRVAVIAVDGITAFHLSTPLLVFRQAARQKAIDVAVCTADGTAITTEEGLELSAQGDFEMAAQADWVVIPAWSDVHVSVDDTLRHCIQSAHARGAKIIGLCLGAFVVCDAGLLDGRSATTHWLYTDELQQQFPAVRVSPAALYVDHGDVITSAGTAAALDACIHVVRHEFGAQLAAEVASYLVIAPHREGNQTQHVLRSLPYSDAPAEMSQLLDYIEQHLAEDLSVEALAQRALLSPRHLTRRFQQIVGSTPGKWVKQRRLDAARRLLEDTAMSVAEISNAVGFASPVTLRQAFHEQFATSPQSYRQRFSSFT